MFKHARPLLVSSLAVVALGLAACDGDSGAPAQPDPDAGDNGQMQDQAPADSGLNESNPPAAAPDGFDESDDFDADAPPPPRPEEGQDSDQSGSDVN